MKSFAKNWKTTLSGIVMIVTGGAAMVGVTVGGVPIGFETAFGLVMGGIGLVFAKDGDVTGGTIRQ